MANIERLRDALERAERAGRAGRAREAGQHAERAEGRARGREVISHADRADGDFNANNMETLLQSIGIDKPVKSVDEKKEEFMKQLEQLMLGMNQEQRDTLAKPRLDEINTELEKARQKALETNAARGLAYSSLLNRDNAALDKIGVSEKNKIYGELEQQSQQQKLFALDQLMKKYGVDLSAEMQRYGIDSGIDFQREQNQGDFWSNLLGGALGLLALL